MTITPGYHNVYPIYEIMIIPRAPESKTIYGCYMKNGISLNNAQEHHSNIWNGNGTNQQLPSIVLIAFLLIVLKLIFVK